MASPQFSQATHRNDPYKNYRFLVKWDGKYVAGVSKVSGLERTTPNVDQGSISNGRTVRVSPGQSKYEPILLERGVTYDTDFDAWASKVWGYRNSTQGKGSTNQTTALKDFRKDIVIELQDEAGQKVMAFTIYRCWVSEYRTLPQLDGMVNAIAIESMTLQNEGWVRGESADEPEQPSYTDPTS
jgi:phage tail-like protein